VLKEITFENCENYMFSADPTSKVAYSGSEEFSALQKALKVDIEITPKELVDAFEVAMRKNCQYFYLASLLYDDIRTMGSTARPVSFDYQLEFTKENNFISVHNVSTTCSLPKFVLQESSEQRVTGSFVCEYPTMIKVLRADDSEFKDRIHTIVNFI
jgi:hypothetical protein